VKDDDMLISGALKSLRSLGQMTSFGGRLRFPLSILRRIFRFVDREVTIKDFDGKLSVRLRLSEHMQRRIFWMGYYSTDIILLLKKELKSGMTFIDVGANIGEITMVAAQCVGSSGRVVAFEPVSAISKRLVDHAEINGLSQIVVRREALGRNRGRMPIYASCGQYVPDEHEGLASLYGECEGQEPIEYVDVIALDDMVASLSLSRVDLIKIDIEGGELACLEGAESVLRHFRPMLIVEIQEFSARKAGWNLEELFRYLQGLGYEFFAITSEGRLKM